MTPPWLSLLVLISEHDAPAIVEHEDITGTVATGVHAIGWQAIAHGFGPVSAFVVCAS